MGGSDLYNNLTVVYNNIGNHSKRAEFLEKRLQTGILPKDKDKELANYADLDYSYEIYKIMQGLLNIMKKRYT
jgi:hypothetical protein